MQLQNIVKAFKSRCGDNDILDKYSMRYSKEIMKRVNKKEGDHEDQKIITHPGLVRVSRLSNTQSSQSDPRIYWIMFHNISAMYRELKNQDTLQSLLEIQNLKSPKSFLSSQLYQLTELSPPVDIKAVLPDL